MSLRSSFIRCLTRWGAEQICKSYADCNGELLNYFQMPSSSSLDLVIERIRRMKGDSANEPAVSKQSSETNAGHLDQPQRVLLRLIGSKTSIPGEREHLWKPASVKKSRKGGTVVTVVDDGQMEGVVSTSAAQSLMPLESLERFATYFRQKRISLGFTQQQVGDALGLRYNSYFSQTTISRFEDLNLSVRNMNKLRPLIQQWIIDTERMFEDGTITLNNSNNNNNNSTSSTSADYNTDEQQQQQQQQQQQIEQQQLLLLRQEQQQQSCLNNGCGGAESNGEQALTSGRRRRKRTTFGGELRSFLEEVFQANPRPSAGQISSLALKLNLDVEVVRVWFCNRRQREARLNLNSF
ncbi:POU domain, class 2, transcription factor 3 [Trichinella murrelli]|uniref:POU domain protein n=1 Tax=Trichinella murrelli TaxID=144512 RepID=A0A0V0UBX6_9BILA|nr:POU domain, class 2, transcription factor 3 [Trichinella murrelli]